MDMVHYDILKEKKAVSITKKDKGVYLIEVLRFDPLTGDKLENFQKIITTEEIIKLKENIENSLASLIKAKQNFAIFQTDIELIDRM